MKVNGKKSTIENDNGLVSIKGTGKRTIVEVSSTYPTTMILSLLICVNKLSSCKIISYSVNIETNVSVTC